jgi:hypothetical protein
MSWIRSLPALLVAAIGLPVVLLTAPSAVAAGGKGEIYLINGRLGQDADFVVDGKTVGKDLKEKTIVGPVSLAAGKHKVSILDEGTVSASSTFTLRTGESFDVVGHPMADASKGDLVTAFRNNLKPVGPGKVRLMVAHTAAAPPADITVNGDVLFSNVGNTQAFTVTVPAKTYSVAVVPSATTGDAILGPVDLTLKAGTMTRVFAIGDVKKKTMDAVVHSLPVKVVGSGEPGAVNTGNGGQAATAFVPEGGRGRPMMLGALLAAVLAGTGTLLVGRARDRRTS